MVHIERRMFVAALALPIALLTACPPPPVEDAGPQADAGPAVTSAPGGDPCNNLTGPVCSDGETCRPFGGVDNGPGVCAVLCDEAGTACAEGGTCVDVANPGDTPDLRCVDVAGPDEECGRGFLIGCGPGRVCFAADDSLYGGRCRATCTCAIGEGWCEPDECQGADRCVVYDADQGLGSCNRTAEVGERCAEDVRCTGDLPFARCTYFGFGPVEGPRCRASCADDDDCAAGDTCIDVSDTYGYGYCLPVDAMEQGDYCVLDPDTAALPLQCSAGLDCLAIDPELEADGVGFCLTACTSSAECGAWGVCDDLVTPDGIDHCRERRGLHESCALAAVQCQPDLVCVNSEHCERSCNPAACASGDCECPGELGCMGFYQSTENGFCTTLAERGETCDVEAGVGCAPAANQGLSTTSSAVCSSSRCLWLCEYVNNDGATVTLECPDGMACESDPAGWNDPSRKFCFPEE